MLFAVFPFLEQFFSSSTVVSVAKANVLQMPTIAVFARNWSGADPNFAPFRWRIWLALSEFLCLLANQNVTFVTLFCTQLPFFCTVLPKNYISLSQSQSRNFFMYIIIIIIIIIIILAFTSSFSNYRTCARIRNGSSIFARKSAKKWCKNKLIGENTVAQTKYGSCTLRVMG